MKVYEPSFDEKRFLLPALNQRLWKCSWLASVIWQGWLGSLRFTCVAEHMVWRHYVRVPCANAAYLFTHLDLKRIGRSQEMFSLHWWRPPHIVVRSEAEACHGHDSVPLTQHSISSMYFLNKRFGFPARWMCTSNSILQKLEQLCWNNNGIHLVLRGSCVLHNSRFPVLLLSI